MCCCVPATESGGGDGEDSDEDCADCGGDCCGDVVEAPLYKIKAECGAESDDCQGPCDDAASDEQECTEIENRPGGPGAPLQQAVRIVHSFRRDMNLGTGQAAGCCSPRGPGRVNMGSGNLVAKIKTPRGDGFDPRPILTTAAVWRGRASLGIAGKGFTIGEWTK